MGLGTPEIILISLVVLLLFGAKRMPDMARSLGESLHIFKKSVKDNTDEAAPPPPPAQQPTPPANRDQAERTES